MPVHNKRRWWRKNV